MRARQREALMDADLVAALARLAGLERALAEFPDDVLAAAAQALGHREAMPAPEPPAAEPWPPMRPGIGL
jgi:hypothetical protein